MNACITSPIAIIGVGLRLPGAVNHLDALWKILQEGRDCISEIPEDRFNAWRFYHPDRTHPGTSVCMQAGLLDSIYAFDCDFFGISLKEASAMDPQQRILLELTWEALEDAGIKPSSLSGSDTCVYVGAASPDSGTCHADDLCSSSPYSMTGTNLSIIANRISYIFNWHGPSFTLDTACSSSMYALHTACQTLAQGGASLAIAAGVNVLLAPYAFVGFSQAYMLSPEGRCKVFDAKGNGYVRSEGGGVLVLEPLELALAQGHNIKAIIRGIGCNSDGRTQGIALPSAKAQEELLATIYDQANCDPETLSYLEAHGTGTVVGDPIEVRAIGRALAQKRSQALPLGSIKCHVGHLETASAMAGIMKALTLMRYQKITPQIHIEELNPEIDFAALKVRVPLEMEDLPSQGTPFRIGVNSFGFGGANGHVLLEAPNNNHQPKIYAQGTPSALPPLFLQAKSETSLTKLAFMVGERITPSNYAALASTLALRRESMPYRLVAEAKDLETLKEALKSPNLDSQNLIFGQSNLQDTHPQTAFVFTGNGCHWLGMAQDLLSWPTFLNKVKEVSDLFYDLSQMDLLTSLKTATKEDLEKTELTQPLIFMIQMGLCEILAEQGIKPDVVFGHSVGEVAAVQAAGLLSLSDAVKVIYYRSLYQGKTKGLGQMAAAKLEVGEALDLISKVAFQEVEIAGINAEGSLTLSGSSQGLKAISQVLSAHKRYFKLLPLDYAFHSTHMEMIAKDLKDALADLTTQTPKAKFISSLAEFSSERLLECADSPQEFSDFGAEYWWQNIRRPVHFVRTIKAALKLGVRCFLEVSPHAILQQYLRSGCKASGISALVAPTMQRKADNFKLLKRIWKQLLVHGWPVDLKSYVDPTLPLVETPSYPWDRKECRLETTSECLGYLSGPLKHPLLGYAKDSDLYEQELDILKEPWLADHKVGEACFYPAACFLEMNLACGALKYGLEQPLEMQNTAILRPVIFDARKSTKLKTCLESLDGEIRIYSRPLMQSSDWVLHTRGRILSSSTKRPAALNWEQISKEFEREIAVDSFYALTRQANMNYGPLFQPLAHIWQQGSNLWAEFKDDAYKEEGLLLSPVLIDGALQLILQTVEPLLLNAKAPVLPYWFDRCRLYAKGTPKYARVELLRSSSRNVVSNITLFDLEGQVLFEIIRGRARLVPRLGRKDAPKLYTTFMLPESLEAKTLPKIPLAALNQDQTKEEASLLIKACAEALVLEADLTNSNLKGPFLTYLQKVKANLVADLPPFAAIFPTLLSDYPLEAETEMLLLSLKLVLKENQALDSNLKERYLENLTLSQIPVLKSYLLDLKAKKEPYTTIKIALNGLSKEALTLLNPALALEEVWLTASNLSHLEILKDEAYWSKDKALFHYAAWDFEKEVIPSGKVDVIFLAHTLHKANDLKAAIVRLKESLRPGGSLVVLEREPSLLQDLINGGDESWWATSSETNPIGRLLPASQWQELFKELGFTDLEVVLNNSLASQFILKARLKEEQVTPSLDPKEYIFINTPVDLGLRDYFKLIPHDLKANPLFWDEFWSNFKDNKTPILWPLSANSSLEVTSELLKCVQAYHKAEIPTASLYLLTFGAFVVGQDSLGSESGAAALGMARVIQNEMPSLKLKIIDLPRDLDAETRLALRFELNSDSKENEVALRGRARFIPRTAEIKEISAKTWENLKLEILDPGHLESLRWIAEPKPNPGPDEVVVEMQACGLNFRDVMWAMNLLPEEALEQGFSGPGLGIEGAGIIKQVGSKVTDLKVGARVVCFGPNCFRQLVLTKAKACALIPANLSFAEAATIPVTFFTAYYALKHLANLTRGERLLIHGAAGGVGLAALALAEVLGVEVYATAGSVLKRELLANLGVTHIYDSRSLSFKDEILRDTQGEGVDCVLNSLAGEALTASLQLLRPFGRFLELGKSDFYADSPLRLKPFANNISYFGIDVDQLMLQRADLAHKLLAELMEMFEAKRLRPLPCQVMEAEAYESAFRLMQKSRHVGKIVLLPPKTKSLEKELDSSPYIEVKKEASYLISGGLAGFGLATAEELVKRGATHLILVSRSGENANNHAGIEELRKKAEVATLACDISDLELLKASLAKLSSSLPPIKGVIHAAANLRDSMLINLTLEDLKASLTPKIEGALVLDKLSENWELDFFVVYSSVTTILGNPGQANYVAGNLAMENLMATRRAKGRPGLALGWGAISDYGMLLRDAKTLASIQNMTGMVPLKAKEALEILFKLPKKVPPYVSVFAADTMKLSRLPIAKQPRFSPLVFGQDLTKANQTQNLAERLKGLSAEEAQELVLQEVLGQLAKILRTPKASLRASQPLQSMGLDSLMGVELSLGLEELCGQPMSGSLNADLTPEELATQILQTLRQESSEIDPLEDLAKVHGVHYEGRVSEVAKEAVKGEA